MLLLCSFCSLPCFMLLLSSFQCVATCPIINHLYASLLFSLCVATYPLKNPLLCLFVDCSLQSTCHVPLFMFVLPLFASSLFCFPFFPHFFFFAFFVLTPFTICLLCACFPNFWFVLHLLIFFGYVFIVSLPFSVSFGLKC